jgi:hypothetical protein
MYVGSHSLTGEIVRSVDPGSDGFGLSAIGFLVHNGL